MKRRAEALRVFRALDRILGEGRPAVVATLVGVDGSAFRRPGARMLVGPEGETVGAISAGCLEEDVRLHAAAVMEEGERRMLEYDTSSILEDSLGLGCDGRLEVFLRPFGATDRGRVADTRIALEMNRPVGLRWELDTGALCTWSGSENGGVEVARREGQAFIEGLPPAPRLLIFGAGDDSRPLAALAGRVGYAVTVVDHRPAQLTAERFPDADQLLWQRPGPLSAHLAPRPGDAAIIKTHSFAGDRAWLGEVLAAPFHYIGLMGPRARIDRLREEVGEDPRIHGPTGLDVGAQGEEQIAVSIVAELLAVRSDRDGGRLRDRARPIHSAV